MSTVQVMVYVVRDTHGNEYSAAVDESSDTIQLCGMKDVDGRSVEGFESEAWHASDWASKHGLGLTVHELELDLDAQRAQKWKVTESCLLPMKRVYVKRKDVSSAESSLWGMGIKHIDSRKANEAGYSVFFVLNERQTDVLVKDMVREGRQILVKDHADTE
jgi:hypothetical protein